MQIKCKKTAQLFSGKSVKEFEPFQKVAQRKLEALDNATSLFDLLSPPSNHFELLKGDRKGQYSIRINSQYRICFRWEENQAVDVEIVDYH